VFSFIEDKQECFEKKYEPKSNLRSGKGVYSGVCKDDDDDEGDDEDDDEGKSNPHCTAERMRSHECLCFFVARW